MSALQLNIVCNPASIDNGFDLPTITATQYFKAGTAAPAFTFGEWSNTAKYNCGVTTYMIY